jgi:hypothetical protein
VSLPLHLPELVGEHLERNRAVGKAGDDVPGEHPVVHDPRLPHQRRVGREAGDVREAGHLQHAGLVGAVGEDSHL